MSDVERQGQRDEVERAQRELFARQRHDLRTPLNAIIGYSEILLQDARDGGLEGFVLDLLRIRVAGTQLLDIITERLDPSRASQPDLDPETIHATLDFELRSPLNAILGYAEILLEDARDGGHEDFIPDLQRVYLAAQRLCALLDGLADSGVRAGEIGADPGTIATSSATGDAVAAVRSPVEEDAGAVSAEQGDLLVVDDDEVNRHVLSQHLERQGHTVAAAENGRQALEMIAMHGFDLVLLDVMMPEMSGYEVLQCLKSDRAWRDIPVIMISALDEMDSVVRCIELGAEDYLHKPFDPVLLEARTKACLEKKRLRDQEVEYLRNVAHVTAAAAAVEAGRFELEDLAGVARRTDGLGQLARVFQSMARQVFAREQRLKQQVRALRIELSEARQARQVAEITETQYFQRVQAEAQDLRDILEGIGD